MVKDNFHSIIEFKEKPNSYGSAMACANDDAIHKIEEISDLQCKSQHKMTNSSGCPNQDTAHISLEGTQINGECNHGSNNLLSSGKETIRISEQFGCNYEKDLKTDLVRNTDKFGGQRNEFYFETDHEALRGNPDYLAVLKTMAILQSQKIQAVKDLEMLNVVRNSAVKDPLNLIAKLQNGESLGLPGRQKIAQLPSINWDRYGLASLSQLAAYSVRKPETRKTISSLVNHVGKNKC